MLLAIKLYNIKVKFDLEKKNVSENKPSNSKRIMHNIFYNIF